MPEVEAKEADPAAVYALHRYFINANYMRHLFKEKVTTLGAPTEFGSQAFIEMQALMGYWYAGLYVVIEGWRELRLRDEAIDTLLQSEHVELLRRYRHGICHFQKRYFDPRFTDLLSKPSVVAWLHDLNRQLGRFLLEYLQSHPHAEMLPPELRANESDEGEGEEQP